MAKLPSYQSLGTIPGSWDNETIERTGVSPIQWLRIPEQMSRHRLAATLRTYGVRSFNIDGWCLSIPIWDMKRAQNAINHLVESGLVPDVAG